MPVSAQLKVGDRFYPVRIGLADIFDIVVAISAAAFLIWQVWLLNKDDPATWNIAALLVINGAASTVGLIISLRCRHPIFLACFYFDYFFFAIAPIQQIRLGFDPIFGHTAVLSTTVTLCLLFTAIGIVALYCCARQPSVKTPPDNVLTRPFFDSGFYPLALFVVLAVAAAGLIGLYGSTLLSTREANASNVLQYFDGPLVSLITGYLNSFVFIGAVVGLLGARTNRNWPWLIAFVILLMLAEFINNPFVTARFRASALIVFAMLVFFGWNNARLLSLFLVLGLVTTPILNSFRSEAISEIDERPISRFFSYMDFDAFSMAAHIVYYVEQAGYSFGYNILSALLFFVPRALWPGKAENIATLVWPQVRYYRNVWTDNLSSPLMAEGYYSFGFLGAALLTAAVFAAFVFLERQAKTARKDSTARLMVCLSPMLAIITMRGAFIVGLSEFCANIAALLAVLALTRVRISVVGKWFAPSGPVATFKPDFKPGFQQGETAGPRQR